MTLGYSSPAGPDLKRSSLHASDSQVSLLGSMMPLGALFGSLACGWFMERFGRRTTMLLVGLTMVIGWLFVMYAGNFGLIVTGRLFTGFAAGCSTVVVPVYVSEMCEPRIRGAMGTCFEFQATSGMLTSYVIGKYAHWNFLAMTCACFASVWPILVCFIHESPLWLLKQGHDSQAVEALIWLRGRHTDVSGEMKVLKEQVEHGDVEKASVLDLMNRDNLPPFVMVMMLMLLQQMSGIMAINTYTASIFEDAGSSVEPNLATIIMGVVHVASTFVAVVLVDRLGRKALLLFSDAIMGACLLVIGVYFYLKSAGNVDDLGWLPLVSLIVYVFASSVGFSCIPWVMMSKFTPR